MNKTCIMVYGRFSPVHLGHGKLFVHANNLRSTESNSDLRIYMTDSSLPYSFKHQMIADYYPWVPDFIQENHASTLFGVLEDLDPLYDKIIVVSGDDRSGKFGEIIRKYNDKLYSFQSITSVSAGPRDNNCYSSTNVRDTILRNDFASYCSLMPPGSYGKNRKNFELLKAHLGVF